MIIYEKEYHLALYNLRNKPYQKLLRSPIRFFYGKLLTFIAKKSRTHRHLRVATFWGDHMMVVIPEPVSETIHRYALYEPGLTLTLLRCLKSDQVFLDVGAHIGYFTLLASKLVGGYGQVHSFEPSLSTYVLLEENSRFRNNIRLNNVALWSKTDMLEFHDYGTYFSAFNSFYDPRLRQKDDYELEYEHYTVPAMSLDKYVVDHEIKPNFVKIDAESAELQILQGMEEVLSRDKPLISLEVGDEGVNGVVRSRDLVCFMLERRFRPFEMTDRGIIAHELLERYRPSNLLFVHEDVEIAT